MPVITVRPELSECKDIFDYASQMNHYVAFLEKKIIVLEYQLEYPGDEPELISAITREEFNTAKSEE